MSITSSEPEFRATKTVVPVKISPSQRARLDRKRMVAEGRIVTNLAAQAFLRLPRP